MADLTRPNFGEAWASGGEKLSPDIAKLKLGWVQEMMPYQYENYLQARQDEAILYLLQKGVPEYSATQEYTANKSVVVYQGNLYMATSTVTGVLPTVTASWKRISPTVGANGAVSISSGGTGATTAAEARTNLGLGTASTVNLPTTNGVVVRSASNTLISRLLTGTSGNISVTNPDGVAGNINIDVGTNVAQLDKDSSWTSRGGITLPKGSSSERGVEVPGKIRYNTELQKFEGYNGTDWNVLGAASEVEITTLSGDGVTTSFTLTAPAFSETSTDVYIGGVWQNKGTYNVSGSTITFSEAPTPGTDNIQVVSRRVVDLGVANASQVSIQDTSNYYTATTVEGALREVGEDFAKLTSYIGTISADAEWSDVPAHSDPAFDAQAQALANRTEMLMHGVGGYSKIREYTGNGTRLKVQDSTGVHWWVRRGSASDNGVTILKDAANRSWEREFSGDVRLDWAGAAGDGLSDDSHAFALAKTACDAHGCRLRLSAKTYRITSPIHLPRYGAIGDAVASTVIDIDIAGATASTNAVTYGVSGDYAVARSPSEKMTIRVKDASSPITVLHIDTPSRNAALRDIRLIAGSGDVVHAKEFWTFNFDNVIFEGPWKASPSSLNPLTGLGFKSVGGTEINNVHFNKCTFTFLRKCFSTDAGRYRGSNGILFTNCLFESIGENLGEADGWQVTFNSCYIEELNKNANPALTYSLMRGGVNNIIFNQTLINLSSANPAIPMFDMEIGAVQFNDGTSIAYPDGFSSSIIHNKTYGAQGKLVVDGGGSVPVNNAFMSVPSQWCGGYGVPRPASPSFKSWNVSRYEYEFTGLTQNNAYAVNEFLEGFVLLKDGVNYFVHIEAETFHRNNNTGAVSYYKSQMVWYISESENSAKIMPHSVSNSDMSDASGVFVDSWLAPNSLRMQFLNNGWRRFAIYRETKPGTNYQRIVKTKYKVRVVPVSDRGQVGIVDGGYF